MKAVQYHYELNGRKGANLFEALRQEDFEEVIEREYEYYVKHASVEGEMRESFVSWFLDELSSDAHGELEAQAGGVALPVWLMSHSAGEIEESYLEKYAREEIDNIAGTIVKNEKGQDVSSLWRDLDIENDVEVARFFNLISFPPTDQSGHYVDTGWRYHIPAAVATEIKALHDEASSLECKMAEASIAESPDLAQTMRDKSSVLRSRAILLESNTVLGLIKVSGFDCTVHCGSAQFEKPIPKTEIIGCPDCGYPICPVCANSYEKDPSTLEEAEEYLASCDEVCGMAYCGRCGDWSTAFMLRFLRLKKCPIPERYENFKTEPRKARIVATERVAKLANLDAIVQSITVKFLRGMSGIISEKDETGEIWGIPERHPEGWIVTICYPEER